MKVTVSSNNRIGVTANSTTSIGSVGVKLGATGLQGPIGPIGIQGSVGIQGPVTAYVFDGGSPINIYDNGPAFDCGGVS